MSHPDTNEIMHEHHGWDGERDAKTKYAFMKYIGDHKDERFFQAVRNFTRKTLRDEINFIYAASGSDGGMMLDDTFYWECDPMLTRKKNEIKLGEEEE